MGFSPSEVRRMSMWGYMAALDGFIAANSPEDKGITGEEADELWALVDGAKY